MSAILHVKGIILTHFVEDKDDLKEAVLDVLNSIDTDLDSCGYDEDIMSDTTKESIENLDKVLAPSDKDEDEDEDEVPERKSPLDIGDDNADGDEE